jgi:hypothetical protein
MPGLPLRQWKQDVLETAADRFERRLTEEAAGLRLEISTMRVELRSDMARMESRLVRWMFAFWIGQFGLTITIVGIILRAVRLL